VITHQKLNFWMMPTHDLKDLRVATIHVDEDLFRRRFTALDDGDRLKQGLKPLKSGHNGRDGAVGPFGRSWKCVQQRIKKE
jgi:hypothetical protein